MYKYFYYWSFFKCIYCCYLSYTKINIKVESLVESFETMNVSFKVLNHLLPVTCQNKSVVVFVFVIDHLSAGLGSDPGVRPHVATAGGSLCRRKQHHRAAEVTLPSVLPVSFLIYQTLCNWSVSDWCSEGLKESCSPWRLSVCPVIL